MKQTRLIYFYSFSALNCSHLFGHIIISLSIFTTTFPLWVKPGETIEEIQVTVSNCVTRSTRECPALLDGGSIRGGGKAYLQERLIALQLIDLFG